MLVSSYLTHKKQHDKVDHKAIRGLASTGRGLEPDPYGDQDEEGRSDDEFISMNEVLEARAYEHPEEIKEPVHPLSIHVGFTGAVFNDAQGREKREVFAVLMVTPADGFALVPYILEKFLQKPKVGAQKYDQLLELYLESSSFFKEIMRFECFCNLAADERKVGLPEEYWMEPGGKLGTSTVLSPFQIPLKIFNIIKTEHPGTALASIRIIGCPEMTFQRLDEFTVEWLAYMHKSINIDAQRQVNLLSGIEKYDNCKDKSSCPDMALNTGGWPVDVGPENDVRIFGLPPLPLMHKFDSNGARGNFSVFIASIGDADLALPDLTRAILTAFLVHSSEMDQRPEIDHLLKDKRKANPLLVLRTYYGPDADPFSSLVLANRQRMWSEALRTDIQVYLSFFFRLLCWLVELFFSCYFAGWSSFFFMLLCWLVELTKKTTGPPLEGRVDTGGAADQKGLPSERGEEPGEHGGVPGLQERDGRADEGDLRSHAVRGGVHGLTRLHPKHHPREEQAGVQEPPVRQHVQSMELLHEGLGGHEPLLLAQLRKPARRARGHARPAHVQVRRHERDMVRDLLLTFFSSFKIWQGLDPGSPPASLT